MGQDHPPFGEEANSPVNPGDALLPPEVTAVAERFESAPDVQFALQSVVPATQTHAGSQPVSASVVDRPISGLPHLCSNTFACHRRTTSPWRCLTCSLWYIHRRLLIQ